MRVRRGELVDVYDEDGRAAVMAGEQVMVLSELATCILASVPETGWAPLDDIVARVIATIGTPDEPLDPHAITRAQVRDLASHAVLVVDEEDAAAATAWTPEAALDAVHRAMAAVSPPSRAVWTAPDDLDGRAFMEAVRRQRVGAQLATRMDRLVLPDDVAAELRGHSRELVAASGALVRDLHEVLDELQRAGVRVLVFKGMALAAQAWGDPTARGHGDLDLLIDPTDLAVAHHLLTRSGWRHALPYPLPGDSWGWRQFVWTGYELTFARRHTEVDLHWHPLPGRSTFAGFEQLWARR